MKSKHLSTYTFYSMVGAIALFSGCGSDDETASSLNDTMASELSSALVEAGLSSSEADAISSSAKTSVEAASIRLSGVSAAVDENNPVAVYPPFVEGAIDALDDAAAGQADTAEKLETIGAIMEYMTESTVDHAAGLTDEEIVTFWTDLAGFAAGAADDAGIPADELGDALGKIFASTLNNLQDAGLDEATIMDYMPYLLEGIYDHADEVGLESIEDYQAMIQDMMAYATGALDECGVGEESYLTFSSQMVNSATGYLDYLPFTDDEIATISADIVTGANYGLLAAGLESTDYASYFENFTAAATDGLADIEGVGAAWIAAASQYVLEGAFDSLDHDGFAFDAAAMAAYTEIMTGGVVSAWDEAGLSAEDIALYSGEFAQYSLNALVYIDGLTATEYADMATAVTNGYIYYLDEAGLSSAEITSISESYADYSLAYLDDAMTYYSDTTDVTYTSTDIASATTDYTSYDYTYTDTYTPAATDYGYIETTTSNTMSAADLATYYGTYGMCPAGYTDMAGVCTASY